MPARTAQGGGAIVDPPLRRILGFGVRAWLVLWVLVAAVVWNGIFDILVTRGVKEYLYRQADHELGNGPAVTMREIMDQTVADAAVTASLWALFVGGAGIVTVYAVRRVGDPAHASSDL